MDKDTMPSIKVSDSPMMQTIVGNYIEVDVDQITNNVVITIYHERPLRDPSEGLSVVEDSPLIKHTYEGPPKTMERARQAVISLPLLTAKVLKDVLPEVIFQKINEAKEA